MNEFITPPDHFGFKAKKISKEINGFISDCAVAYIEPQGGGPVPCHTHPHNHFFIVVEGCATIQMGTDRINVNEDESILLPGSTIHSIWNESDKPLKMIGITIQPNVLK